jgi:cyanate permease
MATKANKQKQQQSEETRPKWTNNNKVNKQQQTATINTWFGLLSNVYYIHAYLVKLLNDNI